MNLAEARRYRLLLACVLLAVLGVLVAVLLTSSASVRVPALRGLTRVAAGAKLNRLHLRAGFSRRYDRAPAGAVIAQAPTARANAAEGSTVHLVLSAGPPPVSLPQLVGQQTAAAEAIVSRLGLSATVNQVPAPGVAPGLVVQQIPEASTEVARHSRVTLQVAETPRWRYLDSFSGDARGDSGPFVIRGSRWRIVESMGYDGTCSFIFFCSGPSATITKPGTGATVAQFDLGEGSNQTRAFASGPGTYEIRVTPGSDSAHWSIRVDDDY